MQNDDDAPVGVLELEANLGEVEKPKEPAAGSYEAEIQNVEEKMSDKGNEYYSIKLVIPTENLPADVADSYEDGFVMYYNRIMKPKGKDRRALYNLRKFYEAMGLDTNITAVDPNDWMGQKVKVRTKAGTWQGEPRLEIASLEPVSSAPARGGKGAAQPAPQPAARGRRR